jgi:hypothetical protein
LAKARGPERWGPDPFFRLIAVDACVIARIRVCASDAGEMNLTTDDHLKNEARPSRIGKRTGKIVGESIKVADGPSG